METQLGGSSFSMQPEAIAHSAKWHRAFGLNSEKAKCGAAELGAPVISVL